jgi:hypothetical protein
MMNLRGLTLCTTALRSDSLSMVEAEDDHLLPAFLVNLLLPLFILV